MRDPLHHARRFFAELKRRRVYRVAVTYLVAGFVVVQVADLAAGAFALPAWFEPMVWVVGALGLPIALVLSWAYDLGPEGIRRTGPDGETDPSVAGAPRTDRGERRRAAPALIAGALLLGVAGAWYLAWGREGEVSDRSIAVLPFEATGGAESLRFSAGLHDGLLTRLTNIAALTVKSRTSAERYGGGDHTVPEIARELGVGWIVEGGVHQSGDRILVNATLIDARRDRRRWAREYEREITIENIFDIQGDLARTIAASLQAELSSRESERLEQRPTDDLDAYRLYIEGRINLDRRTEAGMRRADTYFQRAIERDSGYALAWSGLADVRQLLAVFGYGPSDSLNEGALDAARRALELDPGLAEAHASMGQLYDAHLKDVPSARRELERAVALKPSYAQAFQWLGELEGGRGRREPALEHLRKAAELDPQSAVIQLVLGWTYWWAEGPGPNALSHVRRAKELEPSLAVAHVDEGMILSDSGRHEEAIAALLRGLDLASERSFSEGLGLAGLGVARVAAGDPAGARELLARLEQRGDTPLWEAMVHAALEEEDAAFRALDRVEWTSTYRWDLLVLPAFDPLRDDPRYETLVGAINESWGLNPDGSLPDD